MAYLIHEKSDQVLAKNVIKASALLSRLVGLMGKKDFPISNTFWITPCKSGIHTFFVRFPIDLIFVNKDLQVTSVFKNIKPWRIIYPAFNLRSHSVFEFKTPALKDHELKKGDKLHVGH